ncbi:hypothetical protein BT96DRAFT_186843 [Gymnopus androsaceus JB14]|uniref:F-box domain-containing protein n=1 Tax=Gymnopus androsaceus JB14 TaxID=1447944 RepID=A0A6A4H9R5_9AGAR|nr:hypothetical protein BT96DRAFT_186843 [Gymnopus androsaceus JB14]
MISSIPFLYRDVYDAAIPTLALSEERRLPLTGVHPASYVNKLSISTIDMSVASLSHLQKHMAYAMKNIALHATNGGIQTFTFRSTSVSLPEIFDGTISPALKPIKELFLQCPFPVKSARLSLSLVRFLCGPSLVSLEMDFETKILPARYLMVAKLLEQLPTSCPGLKRLSIKQPYSYEKSETLQLAKVLKDSTFRFPVLTEFCLNIDDWLGNFSESLKAFFQRHLMIEVLHYHVDV